jgi:hypothetical protein
VSRDFSWYSAKHLRFDTSELGIVSEDASLTDRGKERRRPALPWIQPSLVPSLYEFTWGHGASIELADGTVERFALAVHRQ